MSHPTHTVERATRLMADADWDALTQAHWSRAVAAAYVLLGNRADAQDAAQIALLRLLRNASTLPPERSIEASVCAYARNVSLELLKQTRRRERREGRAVKSEHTESLNPLERVQRAEVVEILREELGRLPEENAAALTLHHLDERPVADVARALGISEDACKMRLSRGRERLRSQLERRGVALCVVLLASRLSEVFAEARAIGHAASRPATPRAPAEAPKSADAPSSSAPYPRAFRAPGPAALWRASIALALVLALIITAWGTPGFAVRMEQRLLAGERPLRPAVTPEVLPPKRVVSEAESPITKNSEPALPTQPVQAPTVAARAVPPMPVTGREAGGATEADDASVRVADLVLAAQQTEDTFYNLYPELKPWPEQAKLSDTKWTEKIPPEAKLVERAGEIARTLFGTEVRADAAAKALLINAARARELRDLVDALMLKQPAASRTVNLSVEIYSAPADPQGLELQRFETGSASVLNAEQTATLLKKLEGASAQRLEGKLQPGHCVALDGAKRQAYVADYAVDGDVYDPVIRNVATGFRARARCWPGSPTGSTVVDLAVFHQRLVDLQLRMMDTYTVTESKRKRSYWELTHGAARLTAKRDASFIVEKVRLKMSFPIQFPEMAIESSSWRVSIPSGGAVVAAAQIAMQRLRPVDEGLPPRQVPVDHSNEQTHLMLFVIRAEAESAQPEHRF